MIIAIIITMLITLPIGFFIGKTYFYNKFKKVFSKGKGKYGVVIYYSYNSVDYVVEVEELESAGNLTKVRVIRVCSCFGNRYSDETILKSKSFNEWVETQQITWFNDNSQRLRDEKIKELLGEKS